MYLLTLILLFIGVSTSASDGFSWGVGDAEVSRPGEVAVSLETNSILRGRREPAYEGELTPEGRTHFLVGSSVGILPFWEMSGGILAGSGGEQALTYGGFRVSQKLALPQSNGSPLLIGTNLDFGQTTNAFSTDMWGMGIGPVATLVVGPVSVTFNPYLSWALSSGASSIPSFDPAMRLAFALSESISIGSEYLVSFGEFGDFLPRDEREEMLFGTLDIGFDRASLGVSLGRGLTPASSDWVARAVIGTTI